MSLPTLIADVEGLISALQGVSPEWRNTLLGAWGPLEVIYSVALYEHRNALDDEDRMAISEALDNLERTIKTHGPGSNSLVN